MTQVEWETDLLHEKSLLDAYRASKDIPSSIFNTRFRFVALVLSLLYVVANATFGVDNKRVVDAIARSAAALFGTSATILGFLIAGFSLFASLSSVVLLRRLAATPSGFGKLSVFKYVFFNFVNVFSIYLVLLSAAGMLVFVTPLGWISPLEYMAAHLRSTVPVFNSVILAVLVLIAIESLLRLKSFIWSFYQSVLITIILDNTSDCSDS